MYALTTRPKKSKFTIYFLFVYVFKAKTGATELILGLYLFHVMFVLPALAGKTHGDCLLLSVMKKG